MDLYANLADEASNEVKPEWQRTAYADAVDKLKQYYCPDHTPVAKLQLQVQ